MKVVKPQRVGVLTRPYEALRELRLGVSVQLFVSLGERRELLPEMALWPLASEEMGGVPVLDEGIPKSRAEYLLAGSAYPELGEEAPQCMVRATVAGRSKSLIVSGDRRWDDGRISSIRPFRSLPLEWRYAFGGPSDPENPIGRGIESTDSGGVRGRWLPNIEYPNDQVLGSDSRPAPAGFRALDISLPERARKAGTYDSAWLKEGFPGFARDLDWGFFNLAPQDQQFDLDALALDAPYEFQNMHPTVRVVSGRLPNVRARCFVCRAGQVFEAMEEVALRLTTAWFFPSRERAVLIFQGAIIVAEDDGSDISHLLVAAEDAGVESRAREHYLDVLRRRTDPKTAALFGLKDSELCPAELIPPAGEDAQQLADIVGENLGRERLVQRAAREIEERREMVRSYGLDPDLHGPLPQPANEPAPSLEDLPLKMAQLQDELEAMKVEHERHRAEQDAINEQLFRQLGLDHAVVQEEMKHQPAGPPSFSAEAKAKDLRKLIALLAAQGFPTEHLEEILDDPKQQQLWRDAEQQSRDVYRMSAHLQGAVPPLRADENARARERVVARLAAGSAAGCDFTGCDLTGLSLAGAMLEGALLESTNLSGCDLRGAKLAGAVLAHANLQGALLEGADLRGTNLGSSRLEGANLSDAQLERAILMGANLERARLERAQLTGADFSGAKMAGASFAGARASQTTFLQCDLRGLDFSGAVLQSCNFLEVDLREARFADADLSKTVFLRVKGDGANFEKAHLHNLRLVEESAFEGASFLGADLTEANLRGSKLARARFAGAKLDRADLSSADLTDADLYRASAIGARFVRANLTRARLIGANLMETTFSSARLDGADATGAHFFAADVSRIHFDAATRFTETSATRARLYPKRTEQPPPLRPVID